LLVIAGMLLFTLRIVTALLRTPGDGDPAHVAG
jgi:hypothetical protein